MLNGLAGKAKLAFPTLLIESAWVAALLPTTPALKVNPPTGLLVAICGVAAALPVPLRLTLDVLPGKLLLLCVITKLLVTALVALGENTTLILHEPLGPAMSAVVQLLVWLKLATEPPEKLILLTVNGLPPVLLRATA